MLLWIFVYFLTEIYLCLGKVIKKIYNCEHIKTMHGVTGTGRLYCVCCVVEVVTSGTGYQQSSCGHQHQWENLIVI